MSRFILTRIFHDVWLIYFDRLRAKLEKNHFRKEVPVHYLGYIKPGKVPIVLIPGYGHKWEYISKLGDNISLQGHPTHVIEKLSNNISDVPSSARIVRKHLEEEDIKGAVIVAHSKGGIIGKYLMVYLNEDQRVKGMVSVATPYSGTAIVQFAKDKPNAAELGIDSDLIKDLQQHKEVNGQIISIYPKHDDYIWNPNHSYLPGALDNIKLNERGHRRPLFSKNGHSEVMKAIDRLAKLD